MGIELRRRRKGCQVEDQEMEGYAAAYRAYLARRDLPGSRPTFGDFVEICRVRQRSESLTFQDLPDFSAAQGAVS
jgi:hypothetical protein